MKITTMPGQRLIGFAGYAGAGKDTLADFLGYPKASFAATLKADLYPVLKKIGLDVGVRADKVRARDLLVAYGKLVRDVDPDYWIKNIFIPEQPVVSIADVRYTNEAFAILESGGLVIYVQRDVVGPANSEEAESIREMRNRVQMLTVHNNEAPEIAGEYVKKAVATWLSAVNDPEVMKMCENGVCGTGGCCD